MPMGTERGRFPLAYFAYLFVCLPLVLSIVEKGRLPVAAEWAGPAILSVSLGLCVFLLIRQRRIIDSVRKERDRLLLTDPLTGLGHSSALEDTLVLEVARAKRNDYPLCCIFLDINNFRAINDQYGHTVGNSILQSVGQTILRSVRHQIDVAFRYGGDEFLMLLPGTDKARALIVAERLRESLSTAGLPSVPARKLTFRIGVTQLKESQRAMEFLSIVDRSIHRTPSKPENAVYDADEFDSVADTVQG